MSILIKDLPPDIRRKAVYWRNKKGNIEETLSIAFAWDNAPEGRAYWRKVWENDFTSFPDMTDRYPADFKDFKDPYAVAPIESSGAAWYKSTSALLAELGVIKDDRLVSTHYIAIPRGAPISYSSTRRLEETMELTDEEYARINTIMPAPKGKLPGTKPEESLLDQAKRMYPVAEKTSPAAYASPSTPTPSEPAKSLSKFTCDQVVRVTREPTEEEWGRVGKIGALPIGSEHTIRRVARYKGGCGIQLALGNWYPEEIFEAVPTEAFDSDQIDDRITAVSSPKSTRAGQYYRLLTSCRLGNRGDTVVCCFDDTSNSPGFCRAKDFKGELTKSDWLTLPASVAEYLIIGAEVELMIQSSFSGPVQEYPKKPEDATLAFASRLEEPVLFGDIKLPSLNFTFVSAED